LICARIPYTMSLTIATWGAAFWVRANWVGHKFLPYAIVVVGAAFTYLILVMTLGAIENRNANVALIEGISSGS
jgi:hypothetical protein